MTNETLPVKNPAFASVPSLLARIEKTTFHRPYQTESLAREIQSLEWALRGRSEHNGAPMPTFDRGEDIQNRDSLEESLQRTRALYERHNPESAPFNAVEKNILFHYMQDELQPFIEEGNPTHEMMQEDTSTNVDWWGAWHKQKKTAIQHWRKIRRVLDPRNTEPNFCNVSILRKNSLSGGDPRRYWQGYEELAFTERVQDDIDAISDAQYLQFLTRKAQEWSPVTIMRELGWSKATYEAAMHRLREGKMLPSEEAETPVPREALVVNSQVHAAPPAPQPVSQPAAPLRSDSFALPRKGARSHPLLDEFSRRHVSIPEVAAACQMKPRQVVSGLTGFRRFKPDEVRVMTEWLARIDARDLPLSSPSGEQEIAYAR